MITFEIAKKYLDQGWSVIPVYLSLDEKGKVLKKPAIAWREYQERFPTEEELHKWFDSGKTNAIGLVTGKISHVVVVDVDTISETIHSPIMVKTISGGTHSYFRWTEELRNDTGIDDKPLDFRGDGGFVVLPPSSLGDQSYTWISQTDTMFLTPVPNDIKDKLKIRKQGIVQDSTQKSFLGHDMKLEMSSLWPSASEGNRNNIASQVAGMLCAGISRKLLPVIGFNLLKEWNQTHCSPQLEEKELLTTWNSILSTHIRNHPETVDYNLYTGSEAVEEYKKLKDQYGNGLTTGFSLLDSFFTFIPEQLYLLSSPTHQGKTTLALNIAARIASFGEKVLFASLEQGIFITPRVESMLGKFPENLSILTSHKMITIAGFVKVISELKDKPKIVVIDHLHFIKKQGKGATEGMDLMILELQNMAKELHIPVFVIAHVRKLNDDRVPELDDLRDSSSLSQVPSVVMLLYRKKNPEANLSMGESYLSSNGILLIAKNRIYGKTGILSFKLQTTGEFNFY